MNEADSTARGALLGGPLIAALTTRWPQIDFELDLARACERPGEPITVSWVDGPTVATLSSGLGPGFSTAHEPAGHAYPVVARRSTSMTAQAAVLMLLHETGQLAAAADQGRRALTETVQQRLETMELPEGLDAEHAAAGELICSIAATAVGQDLFAWACWLTYGGGAHVLTDLIPAALGRTGGEPHAG